MEDAVPSESPREEPPLRPLLVPVGLAGMIGAMSISRPVSDSADLARALQITAAGLLVATAGVAWLAHRRGAALRIRAVVSRVHWVQLAMHTSLFVGWAPYFPGVVEHVPHIAAQVLFYYAFELLLSFSRRDEARTGFGPLPIVGSTNLFLWFVDAWFLLQFAMLAVGALAKEFLTWERDGRRTHVFNPSSFPLFLVCLVLWATDGDALTFATDIAVTQGEVPYGWAGVFVLGLVVQSLFAVTLVTLGAVSAIFVASSLFVLATGSYPWVDVGVPVAVYLGCHFLITDPATSPRTAFGRAGFGVLYGLSVFVLFIGLRATDGPAHYDKLLCVPFLNLLVRRLDAWGGGAPSARDNAVHVGFAVLLYLGLAGVHFLGTEHPGRSFAFWEKACREERWLACDSFASLLDDACHAGEWAQCEAFARRVAAGDGVERDLVDAGYHYTLACQQGITTACEAIPGFRAAGGDEALRARCGEDEGLACLVLGALLTGGHGGPADPEASGVALRRACALEVSEACDYLERRVEP